MDQARSLIAEVLTNAQQPGVLWSGGKDSQLLFHLAREVYPDIPAIWFRTPHTDESAVLKLAMDQQMTVYSHKPADVRILTDGDTHTIVRSYSFGDDLLPLLTDITEGTRCSITAFPERTYKLYQPWDVLLVGWKDCDTHWIKGDSPLKGDGFMLGKARVYAPLRHLSNEQVYAAAYEMKVPIVEPAEPQLCTRCMTHSDSEVFCPDAGRFIPTVEWDRQQALNDFRNQYGVEVSDGRG